MSEVVAETEEDWKVGDEIENDDIEPMDMSPWAGSDRDYSYEEVTPDDQSELIM